jgi:hypothetical protein
MKMTAVTHLVNTSIRCPTISNVDFSVDDFALVKMGQMSLTMREEIYAVVTNKIY